MHLFDATASQFDRHRAFPEGVAEAIRRAVWSAMKHPHPARVLDLGAGTGRIGRAFVAAHDEYFGVDLSFAMLREFQNSSAHPQLVQADGGQLPFTDHCFGVVMLMQVLSGASDWQPILSEACRVVQSGGMIIAGNTTMPPEGTDKRMKNRLSEILAESGASSRGGGNQRRNDALAWLEQQARRRLHKTAASWNASRTPRQFLERHKTGAQFSALPAATQTQAMAGLSAWAEQTFGSLDTVFREQHSFELEIFEF